MYYSYVEIEYIATSFSLARTDLALKLLSRMRHVMHFSEVLALEAYFHNLKAYR
jgi:hypothetical protein